MNRLTIIGNLANEPELRTTASGTKVCTFTVAVNRRHGQEQTTEFFRVTAWRILAEHCAQYLSKGRKVAVNGEVTLSTYTGRDGTMKASMEVTAQDVEFLSPKTATEPNTANALKSEYVEVEGVELPF